MKNLPFYCAKVGDKVYSSLIGVGTISRVALDDTIYVRSLDGKHTTIYYADGHYMKGYGERILFYVDEAGTICDERPLEKLYADMLSVDTRLFVVWRDSSIKNRRYYAGNNKYYKYGTDSWTAQEIAKPLSPLDELGVNVYLAEDFGQYKAGTPVYVRKN